MSTYQHLLIGHDTLECAYYLNDATAGRGIGMDWLRAEKESILQDKKRRLHAITLGGIEFYLHGTGTSSGYPFLIENSDFTISFGEFNMPSFYVKYRSEALWREGAWALHERFLQWADSLGYRAAKAETISRVDFTFDYVVETIDFDLDSVVSMSAKDGTFRKDRQAQTIQYGAGGDAMLRIYDKIAEIQDSSHKFWFQSLWGGVFENVWRIEWQVRKGMLKRFGVRSMQDLAAQQGDVLTYLAHDHDTLRIKTDDSNRSRWPLHPIWLDLQQQIKAMNREGVTKSIDPVAALNERLTRAGIAVYGYLKNIGALQARLNGRDNISKDEALLRLSQMISKLHDPMTWNTDIERRITDLRLGK